MIPRSGTSAPVRLTPSAAAGECAARLLDVAPLAMRFIRSQMRSRMPGLTMAQYRAMSYLYRNRGCTLRALADHLGVTPPTCSALVGRLVDRGIATRTTNLANRREVTLRLTPAGRTSSKPRRTRRGAGRRAYWRCCLTRRCAG